MIPYKDIYQIAFKDSNANVAGETTMLSFVACFACECVTSVCCLSLAHVQCGSEKLLCPEDASNGRGRITMKLLIKICE